MAPPPFRSKTRRDRWRTGAQTISGGGGEPGRVLFQFFYLEYGNDTLKTGFVTRLKRKFPKIFPTSSSTKHNYIFFFFFLWKTRNYSSLFPISRLILKILRSIRSPVGILILILCTCITRRDAVLADPGFIFYAHGPGSSRHQVVVLFYGRRRQV